MKKRTEEEIWKEFLSNASIEDIHKSVINSNWDGNDLLLNWIKDNPKVDKATILIAYWMSGPRWMKQYQTREDVPDYELEDFDFIEELEKKYVEGFWTTSTIEIDPACDHYDYNWTTEYQDKPQLREIPAIMFEKLEGIKIEDPDDFDEGLPSHYAQQIWDLDDEEDEE